MKQTMLLGIAMLGFNVACARTWDVPPDEDAAFTSSDVADVTEGMTGRRAHMGNGIRALVGPGVAGPAVTLRLVPDESASSVEAGLVAIQLLESANPGAVVVAVLDGDKDFAVFGAAFATLAKERNLAGFVVDGSVRDLLDLRRLEFPTFARGTAPGSAGGHYRVGATNIPVQSGGIEVRPGDYVVADEDGVAVVPADLRQEVLAAAAKNQTAERALLRAIERLGSYRVAIEERAAAQDSTRRRE